MFCEEMTGTTIIATKCDGGVLVGADTRTSMGTYIPSKVTDKLTRLSDKIFVCRSGSSADTQVISDYVRMHLNQYSYLEESVSPVRRAAVFASNIIHENPSMVASLIIAGYDDSPKVFDISLGGTLIECNWTIGGSGSAFIYGYCDANWKENMTLMEGIEFIKMAVSHAIIRDNASGGCVRIASVSKDGVQRYFLAGNKILQ